MVSMVLFISMLMIVFLLMFGYIIDVVRMIDSSISI